MSQILVTKDIRGYSGLYTIDSLGRIFTSRRNFFLKNTVAPDGYARVSLIKNKIRKGFTVHRLVGITLLKNPKNKPVIDHINKNRSDNRLVNLRWATHRENNLYSKHSRTNLRGAYYHPKSKNWEAAIMLDGANRFYIGVYSTKNEAHYAFHFFYTVLFNKEPFDICLIK